MITAFCVTFWVLGFLLVMAMVVAGYWISGEMCEFDPLVIVVVFVAWPVFLTLAIGEALSRR